MIPLASKPNVNTANPDYPMGKLVDDTGTANGTPVNEQVYNDMHQFFEQLMVLGGLTPNGLPENETNGYQLPLALDNMVTGIANLAAAAQFAAMTPSQTLNSLPTTLDFTADKHFFRTAVPAPSSITLNYNLSGAVRGRRTRLVISLPQSGSTFTLPAGTIRAEGVSNTIVPPPSGGYTCLEFTYLGVEAGVHFVSLAVFNS